MATTIPVGTQHNITSNDPLIWASSNGLTAPATADALRPSETSSPWGFNRIHPVSDIYRHACIAAEQCTPDHLLMLADVLTVNAADDTRGEVLQIIASEQLRAVRTALQRWERISRMTAGVASVADRKYEQWRDLAQLCRERLEISEVFQAGGYHLKARGRNGRRGCPEWAGACPVCGTGDDRLRVWDDGPTGRAWCRICDWSGDHVTVAMALNQCSFRDAVMFLARLAGEVVPL